MAESHALWRPTQDQLAAARLTQFARQAGLGEQCQGDYAAVHAWSVREPAQFWRSLWDFAAVRGQPGEPIIAGQGLLQTRFFPEARLNFAENLLAPGADDDTALIFRAESGLKDSWTRGDLRRSTAAIAQAFARHGLQPGDRVAAMMPNRPETVAAMLATAALGGVWSSCSPDFGAAGVLDRFGQIEPTVLLCSRDCRYNGKHYQLADKSRQIREQLPSLKAAFMLDDEGFDPPAGFLDWEEELQDDTPAPLAPLALPFDHPLYILYSSGTTGAPKCIVHGAGGTLLQHLKEHQLHCDIRSGDVMFYYSTCGWMMWNWLASGLASGAALMLYDGAAMHPHPETLLDFAQDSDCSFFGVSAKYLDALRHSNVRPRATHKLAQLRSIASTGSPLTPETFDFVYQQIKPDVALQSISGGTDIVSCFVLGNPWQPIHRGEIQCAGLGMAVDIFDTDGQPLPAGEKGELVCTAPFPSRPLGFWNDPDDHRYHASYFERFPGVWHHGDFAERTARGGFVIHGRSDATLNPGGVRLGTAEIYRQVESLDAVLEALAVGQRQDNDMRILLFVVLQAGQVLDLPLEREIRQRIREGASPRHVPARIVQVQDLPRTHSGKLAELAVQAVIHGDPVKNREALANPECLEQFIGITA